MGNLEILKELYLMVQKRNYIGDYELGFWGGTSLNKNQRSKDITSFLKDLFEINKSKNSEIEDLLFMLEDAIHENICGEKVKKEYFIPGEENLPFP